ncbi:RPB7-like OB fold RNA polymerase subunit [Cryptosporidium canis]|uniref:RPB7-like OB fold RNA polymerase subunit n=1 Tax=Cryptosporidium canis TaxID=195482 RepID=A0A9D5DKD6_9CRYT|nr:RPB7-like OB fold RNA polymerase subunit [Cryptosporidium canis]
MYQIPWEVKETCLVTNEVAYHLIGKCIRSIGYLNNNKLEENGPPGQEMDREIEKFASEQLRSIRDSFINKGKYDNECFELLRVKGTVQLLPNSIGNIEDSIKKYLCCFLFHYIAEFHGVWVCFHKISTLNTYGYIPDCEPNGSFLVNVEFKALVFKPKIGELLICRISHISPSHISGITYGILNVVIPMKNFKGDEYEFQRADSIKYETNTLVNKVSKEKNLKIGSKIFVRIKKYHFSDGGDFVSSISGQFESIVD